MDMAVTLYTLCVAVAVVTGEWEGGSEKGRVFVVRLPEDGDRAKC